MPYRAQPSPVPLLVISPHLDDAVLGCGRLLSGHPDSTVLTVFAGGRPDWSTPTAWDGHCGFRPGEDVISVRRQEDRAALAVLGAVPQWLDLPEEAYRLVPADLASITVQIERCIEAIRPGLVVTPLGLFHADHKIASEASLGALKTLGIGRWILYGDLYALTQAHLVRARLGELESTGIALRPTALPSGSRRRKHRSLRHYKTQRRGLGASVIRRAAYAPEQIWVATSG